MAPALPDFYAALYCEENVWRLLNSPLLEGAAGLCAVFISNPKRTCALWQQRSAQAPEAPVLWDYHVVALGQRSGWEIWDLDSQLPFPSPAGRYLQQTFPRPGRIKPEYRPRFRVVPAAEFRERFASDRSHMRGEDGRFRAEPPPLPPIGQGMNLWRWVQMEEPFAGEVLDLPGMLQRVAILPAHPDPT
jgi:hypothetical protein